MNLVKLQDTKLIHRNLLHFYTLTTKGQKEKKRISDLENKIVEITTAEQNKKKE